MRRRARDDQDADDVASPDSDQATKRQALMEQDFVDLNQLSQNTRSQIDKNKRLQARVIQRLQRQDAKLKQIEAELKAEQDALEREKRQSQLEIAQLQERITTLSVEQEQVAEASQEAKEYRATVRLQLARHVGDLRDINSELSNLAQEYRRVLRPEDEQDLAIFLEQQVKDLLQVAGDAMGETWTVQDLSLDDVNVDGLTQIMNNLDEILGGEEPITRDRINSVLPSSIQQQLRRTKK